MSAFLKIYSDNLHTVELAHNTDIATTINHTGGYAAGATSIVVANALPGYGTIDIIDATNGNETIAYATPTPGVASTTLNLLTPLAHLHPNNCVVNEWYYSLPVGDQVNGVLNDGTNATPNGIGVNVQNFYLYNAGDQKAQTVTMSTSNVSPSTSQGYTDTLLSQTSATAGFAASLAMGNIASGAQVQFWAVAEVTSGQSFTNNPQACVVNLAYQSV